MNKEQLTAISEETFSRFWEAYPRKQKKKKAFSLWVKLNLYKMVDLLIEDIINRIKNDHQWQDKQYIPLPTSYMNGELWEDEIIMKTVKPVSKNVDIMSLGREKGLEARPGESMNDYEQRVRTTR